LAVQIFSRVRETFEMDLQMADPLQLSTVAATANYIETVHWLAKDQSAPRGSGREKLRL